MAISGFNPTSTLPGMAPASTATLGASPLLGQQPASLQGQAALGATERPGIGSRLMSAMRAAIGELRGTSQPNAQQLALQAQQPVTLAKQAEPAPTARKVRSAKTWTDKQGNLRQVGTGTVLKPAGANAAAGAGIAQPVGGQPVPTNATQLPNATVYSYDANGNPVAAPTMQQLGVTPTMLQGLTGLAGAVDAQGPQGPQVNATNQTNLSGIGSGVGFGFGSTVPVLGQPIATTSPGDTGAPTTPHSGSAGGTQAVSNRNVTDVNNRNQGLGYGWGGWGDPTGGIATPYTPYGSSMTGASALGQENRGFFSRLLGR